MGWWGKVLGGTFGFMVGGPLGALLGAALGHRFDQGAQRLTRDDAFGPGAQERVQTAFFTASFSVMTIGWLSGIASSAKSAAVKL